MASTKLRELFWAHRGLLSDKWEQYLTVYEAELELLLQRGTPLSLLEIGVQNGGSLELWHKVLPPNSHVVGIDIDERCRELKLGEGIQVHIGDATQPDFVDGALGDTRFDIIVDDGSHLARDVIASFDLLFGRLKPGGVYIVEDMHASYWAAYGGGFRVEGAPIEWAKDLVDALNVDHFEDNIDLPQDELARLQALNAQIARLAFFDSMLVIQKHASVKNRPFARMLTGAAFPVLDPLAFVSSLPADKLANFVVGPSVARHLDSGISDLIKKKDADLARQKKEIARQEQEIARQAQEAEHQAREIRRHADEVKQQAREIKRQAKEIERQERKNRNLLMSTSWKVTAPLRKAIGFLTSARDRLRRSNGPR